MFALTSFEIAQLHSKPVTTFEFCRFTLVR